jgi:hypothetical protein
MKKTLIITAFLLVNISTSALAFNLDNRANHEVHVWCPTPFSTYHTSVKSHSSKEEKGHSDMVLCAEWSDKKDPFYKNCCEVRSHGQFVINGNYKTDSNPSTFCH